MSRNRPGKRERKAQSRAAILQSVNDTVKANRLESKSPRPLACGPKGLGDSPLARVTLKAASHTATFAGPRGYASERTVTLGAQERMAMRPRDGEAETRALRGAEAKATTRRIEGLFFTTDKAPTDKASRHYTGRTNADRQRALELAALVNTARLTQKD